MFAPFGKLSAIAFFLSSSPIIIASLSHFLLFSRLSKVLMLLPGDLSTQVDLKPIIILSQTIRPAK
jgi:hypothetical protein